MPHVVLLGDSIFDNARYVPGEPSVIDQLRGALPEGWQATLLAIDCHVTGDVANQMEGLPVDATHLVVSVGGNDALAVASVLYEPAKNVAEGLMHLREVCLKFRTDYQAMLEGVLRARLPTAVCTIYDAIPGIRDSARTALMVFNDSILRAAFTAGLPAVDLRLVCPAAEDYSSLSPIEPSAAGGAKIARAIAELLTTHDFSQRRSAIYT